LLADNFKGATAFFFFFYWSSSEWTNNVSARAAEELQRFVFFAPLTIASEKFYTARLHKLHKQHSARRAKTALQRASKALLTTFVCAIHEFSSSNIHATY